MTDEFKAPSDFTQADANLRPNLEPPAMPRVKTIEFEYPQLQAIRDPGIDVLLLVATTVELRAACSALSPIDGEALLLCFYRDDVAYYVGRLGVAFTVAVMSRMAADSAGGSLVVAKNAIALTRPAAVIAVGIAFGANPAKQTIGDVLVASQIINYELQRVQPGRSISRGSRPETGQLLGNLFREVTDWEFKNIEGGDCRVEFGPVLSGAKLIDDIDYKLKLLKDQKDAIGGEMEGTGVYAAVRDATVPPVSGKLSPLFVTRSPSSSCTSGASKVFPVEVLREVQGPGCPTDGGPARVVRRCAVTGAADWSAHSLSMASC